MVKGIAGVLSIAAVIIAIDVPYLILKKFKKELWIFSVFLLFGIMLSIAQILHMELPNPAEWIQAIYKPVSDWVNLWLK